MNGNENHLNYTKFLKKSGLKNVIPFNSDKSIVDKRLMTYKN